MTLAEMPNLFLIIRFALFALMLITSILSLSFASWNIHATSAAQISPSAVAVLLVFTSCLTIICITLALLELPLPHVRASWVMFECIWSAVLSIFQIGAAIGITVNFAMLSHSEMMLLDPSIQVSTTLLVPTTWFNCFTLFSFFFVFFISALTHRGQHDDIWDQSPYAIRWFSHDDGKSSLCLESGIKTRPSINSWARYMNDAEWCPPKHRQSPTLAADSASLITNEPVRRGIDVPFAPRTTQPLRVPGKVPLQEATQSSRFIERFRESRILSRPGSLPIHDQSAQALPPNDQNLPIPLPRRSQWIPADAITSRY